MFKSELDFIYQTVGEFDYRLHILRLMRESVSSDAQETYDSVVQALEIIVPALNAVYTIERRCNESETHLQKVD